MPLTHWRGKRSGMERSAAEPLPLVALTSCGAGRQEVTPSDS